MLFYILIAFIQFGFSAAPSYPQIRELNPPAQGDEITFSYKYITDTNGWNSSAEFYLTNHTNQKQHVTWSFTGTENADMRSDGGITDIEADSTKWIATFTALDISKPWNSGRLHYEWKPIN